MSAIEWVIYVFVSLMVSVSLFGLFPQVRPHNKHLPLVCALSTICFGVLHWSLNQPSSSKLTILVIVYATTFLAAYKITERFSVKTVQKRR